MSTSSHFSEEMEAMDVDEWNWVQDSYMMRESGRLPKRPPCWRSPKVFYTALFLVVAAMVGLAVTGILMGTDGAMMRGWRPNRGTNGGGEDPSTNDGDGTDVEGTNGFANKEPSTSPTALAPTAPPTMAPTNSPTQAPTRRPRTTPLAFYVIGDGTCITDYISA